MALGYGTYTIQQRCNTRFLDAYGRHDFEVVTRQSQLDDSQKWIVKGSVSHGYSIQQKNSMRFLDAYEDHIHNFQVVTRDAQSDDSQKWIFTHIGGNVYSIQQKCNMRFLDAYEDEVHDFKVVTRDAQKNDSQKWILLPADSHDPAPIDPASVHKLNTSELRDLLGLLHCSRSGRKDDLVHRVLSLSQDNDIAHVVNTYIAEKDRDDDDDDSDSGNAADLNVQIAKLTVSELKALLALLHSAHTGHKDELMKKVFALSKGKAAANRIKEFIADRDSARDITSKARDHQLDLIPKPSWATTPSAIHPGDSFSFVYAAGMRPGKRRTVSFYSWCLLRGGSLGLCAREGFADPPYYCTYKVELMTNVLRSPTLADQIQSMTANELQSLLFSLKEECSAPKAELVQVALKLSHDKDMAQLVSHFVEDLGVSKRVAEQQTQERLKLALKPPWAKEPDEIKQGDRLCFVYASGLRAGKSRTVTFDAWIELQDRSLGFRALEDFGEPQFICHYKVELMTNVERISAGHAAGLSLKELQEIIDALKPSTPMEKRQRIPDHALEEVQHCVDQFLQTQNATSKEHRERYEKTSLPGWAQHPAALSLGDELSFVYSQGSRAGQRRSAIFKGWTQLSGGRLGMCTEEDFGASGTRQYDVQLIREVQRKMKPAM